MPTREIEDISRQIDRMTFDPDPQSRKERDESDKADARFRNIMVAFDGSEGAYKALEWGVTVAKAHEARLEVVLVLPQQHPVHGTTLPAINRRSAQMWSEYAKQEEEEGKKMLADALKACEKAGVKAKKRLQRGPVVKTVSEISEAEKNDLVIVGSHGRRGLERFLMGSVAEGVRDHVRCSVLIARNRPPQQKTLLAVDGSESSRKAGRVLAGLMEHASAWVHVVHVVHAPVEGLEPEVREKWQRATQDLRGPLMKHVQFPTGSWVHYDIHFGNPADEVLRIAKEDECGLIVLGSRGLSGVHSLVAGSVSRRVSHHADASVLLVK